MSPVLFVINPSLGITGFLPDATLNNATAQGVERMAQNDVREELERIQRSSRGIRAAVE